jgi:transcriptional regulator with XRE-family HTH domain
LAVFEVSQMQRSAERHILGTIRTAIELTQADLARVLGVSTILVQRIEQGRINLSERLARKTEAELDLSAAWLLANDPDAPPVTPRGSRWHPGLFQSLQGFQCVAKKRDNGKPSPDAPEIFAELAFTKLVARLDSIIQANKARPQLGIILYRLNRFLDEMKVPIDPAAETKYQTKINRLEKKYRALIDQAAQAEEAEQWANEPEAEEKPLLLAPPRDH